MVEEERFGRANRYEGLIMFTEVRGMTRKQFLALAKAIRKQKHKRSAKSMRERRHIKLAWISTIAANRRVRNQSLLRSDRAIAQFKAWLEGEGGDKFNAAIKQAFEQQSQLFTHLMKGRPKAYNYPPGMVYRNGKMVRNDR